MWRSRERKLWVLNINWMRNWGIIGARLITWRFSDQDWALLYSFAPFGILAWSLEICLGSRVLLRCCPCLRLTGFMTHVFFSPKRHSHAGKSALSSLKGATMVPALLSKRHTWGFISISHLSLLSVLRDLGILFHKASVRKTKTGSSQKGWAYYINESNEIIFSFMLFIYW